MDEILYISEFNILCYCIISGEFPLRKHQKWEMYPNRGRPKISPDLFVCKYTPGMHHVTYQRWGTLGGPPPPPPAYINKTCKCRTLGTLPPHMCSFTYKCGLPCWWHESPGFEEGPPRAPSPSSPPIVPVNWDYWLNSGPHNSGMRGETGCSLLIERWEIIWVNTGVGQ